MARRDGFGEVAYEWDVETVTTVETPDHEAGEVVEHRHCDSLREALAVARDEPEPGTRHAVVLVCDDIHGRSWAYLDAAGQLPTHFEGAEVRPYRPRRVPDQFRREVAAEILRRSVQTGA